MTERLTSEQVIETVGHLDDERVLEVIDTGATLEELAKAMVLASQVSFPGVSGGNVRIDVVHSLYDILRAGMIEREER
jgi:hypothetical protein